MLWFAGSGPVSEFTLCTNRLNQLILILSIIFINHQFTTNWKLQLYAILVLRGALCMLLSFFWWPTLTFISNCTFNMINNLVFNVICFRLEYHIIEISYNSNLWDTDLPQGISLVDVKSSLHANHRYAVQDPKYKSASVTSNCT